MRSMLTVVFLAMGLAGCASTYIHHGGRDEAYRKLDGYEPGVTTEEAFLADWPSVYRSASEMRDIYLGRAWGIVDARE